MHLLCMLLCFAYISAGINSRVVDKSSSSCIVSLTIPEENLKSVCERGKHYQSEQKLRSVETQLHTLRRKVNNIDARIAYTITRRHTHVSDISERILTLENQFSNLQSKFTNTRNEDITNWTDDFNKKGRPSSLVSDNPNLSEDWFKRQNIEEVIKREVTNFEQKLKKDIEEMILSNRNSQQILFLDKNVQNDKEFVGDNSSSDTDLDAREENSRKDQLKEQLANASQNENLFGDDGKISFLRMIDGSKTDERKQNANSPSTYYIDRNIDLQYKRRFEAIEHDIETLANGLASLHQNMFESEDVKKAYETEKNAMESEILEKIRNDMTPLESETEYTKNQTIIISKLLRATIKSQEEMHARAQNMNATFRLKSFNIEKDILILSGKLDALNGTLNPAYGDTFSVGEAVNVLKIEDSLDFLHEIKQTWPSVISNLTHLAVKQEQLSSIVYESIVELEDKKEKCGVQNPQVDLRNSYSCNGYHTRTIMIFILPVFLKTF